MVVVLTAVVMMMMKISTLAASARDEDGQISQGSRVPCRVNCAGGGVLCNM